MNHLTVIDFETLPIRGRPHYPPSPVGLAIRRNGKSKYLAFGHINGKNNATWDETRFALRQAWDGPLLFHNAKFDLDVAMTEFGLSMPPWVNVHDTLPLLFLRDPRAESFSLKSSAESILKLPPEERDAVNDWLIENQPIPGVRISASPKSDHYAGAYIAYAPSELVAPYAIGDVDRTAALFDALMPEIERRKMRGAYDREMRMLPHILRMEREGIRIDGTRLQRDIESYNALLVRIDEWINRRCKAMVNADSARELVPALIKAGLASEEGLGVTATGQIRTSKEARATGITDATMRSMLTYREQLCTSLRTFMEPWYAQTGGKRIYTTWHSTRTSHRGGSAGARTGRFSSTPNFQNIIVRFDPLFAHEGKGLPNWLLGDPLPLPKVRSYIIPDHDHHTLIDRDWSQQEPRILAHFEGGALLQAYLKDNWIDFHDQAKEELKRHGRDYPRKIVKNFNLGIIYGEGVGSLAEKTGIPYDEAKQLKQAIYSIYPGLREMYQDMRDRAELNLPIRTWGGREYYCEPAKVVDGQLRRFDYKLVNVLIQGSAADCAKEALIRFCEAAKPDWRLLMTVHDELVVSCPIKERDEAMECLKVAMESVEFDVPILSEGSSGPNWGALVDYDKRGKRAN